MTEASKESGHLEEELRKCKKEKYILKNNYDSIIKVDYLRYYSE